MYLKRFSTLKKSWRLLVSVIFWRTNWPRGERQIQKFRPLTRQGRPATGTWHTAERGRTEGSGSSALFAWKPSRLQWTCIICLCLHTHAHAHCKHPQITTINQAERPVASIGFLISLYHIEVKHYSPYLVTHGYLISTRNKGQASLISIHNHQPASYQLQHPWAASAGGKASKQAKNDDDGPGADEDVWGVGRIICYQRDVRAQHQLPPYSYCQQDGSCYLVGREGVGGREGCNTKTRIKAGEQPLSIHFCNITMAVF